MSSSAFFLLLQRNPGSESNLSSLTHHRFAFHKHVRRRKTRWHPFPVRVPIFANLLGSGSAIREIGISTSGLAYAKGGNPIRNPIHVQGSAQPPPSYPSDLAGPELWHQFVHAPGQRCRLHVGIKKYWDQSSLDVVSPLQIRVFDKSVPLFYALYTNRIFHSLFKINADGCHIIIRK